MPQVTEQTSYQNLAAFNEKAYAKSRAANKLMNNKRLTDFLRFYELTCSKFIVMVLSISKF